MIDWTLPIETDEPNPRSTFAIRIAIAPDKYSVTYGAGIRLTYDDDGRPDSPAAPHTPNIRNDCAALHTSDEALSRMEALVRRMGGSVQMVDGADYDEAREIVAMLPVPVDPDLIEARRIAADVAYTHNIISIGEHDQMRDGANDAHSGVIAVLAGIRLGRELAQEGK